MSNHFSGFVWEGVSQQLLNEFCDADKLPHRARHKWVHIRQAVRLCEMSAKEIYKEGFRDFLAVRSNNFHYMDIFHHVDGILHPDPVVARIGKVAFERFGDKVYRQLNQTGLPTELDLGLFSLIFDDPEIFHKKVRKSVRDIKGQKDRLGAISLPNSPYNGKELREMGLWQDADEDYFDVTLEKRKAHTD